MTDLAFAWWASLNHGGLLIAPAKLAEQFPPQLDELAPAQADRLRRDLTRLREGGEDRLSAFLDTVLEDVLGLSKARWTKGSEVDRAWSIPAVTREIIRPRRVWLGPSGAVLPVFVADKDGQIRLGVGRGKRPVSRVVEWLRRAAQDPNLKTADRTAPRFALLASGRQLRLIHAGTDYDAFCEWDTALWFQEGVPGQQVAALRALLSAEAIVPRTEGQPSPLLAAIQSSRQGQAELSSALGERVRQAVELLIRESGSALERIDAGVPGASADLARVARRDIYVAATRLVMRCVVILFAEARELLPRSNAIYEGSYGLQGLRAVLDRASGGRASERLRYSHGAWPRLLSLFHLVYHGSQHEALPVTRYGGGLFTPGKADSPDPILRALAAFESADNAPSDHAIHAVLELLCRSRVRVRQGKSSRWVEAPVDFSDLSSEYLGILYEGLLDFELRRAPADDAMVFLNLGDQPALPLSRLDAMNNDKLGQLLEKLKKSGEKVKGEEGEEEAAAEEDAEGDEGEGEGVEANGEGAEAEAEDAVDDGAGDDLARDIREKARIWSERAVKAAKLVKYPKKDTDPRVREQYSRDVSAVARGLVARLIQPGEWFLVRWGGTRKGSGTFYTRPQLAGPIVRRALQPLAYSAVQEVKDEATGVVTVTEWAPRKPEEILALKVCDPAMGSGSFLISALRYLTEALVEGLHYHGRFVEHKDQTICRLADGLPVEHPSHETLPVPKEHAEFDERLRARLKRYVVERCIYGVDLDPLAVELAKTALWVETMDWKLAFGFLDHKLKCGNALVGCWFDRFQDYPIMAWEREGGDKGHDRFVHHFHTETKNKKPSGDKWTAAIKKHREDVIKPELKSWLLQRDPKQTSFLDAQGEDADALHAEALAVFEQLHNLPIDKTEERETLYREKIVTSDPLIKLKVAFDTWCALWFWPGADIEIAPTPKDFLELNKASSDVVAHVAAQYRFLHWEIEFADVFTGAASGFSAVIGNPPWEIQKPNSMEFFSNVDPLYRTYGKQEALKRQRELFEATAHVEQEWIYYSANFKASSNWIKNVAHPFGGEKVDALGDRWKLLRSGRRTYADVDHPFQQQGSADINTYKMFLEVAHALLARSGSLGLLVPSGIYSDNGSRALRELFLRRCAWTHLYAFQNERFVFKGIDHRFKMAAVHVRKGNQVESVLTRFRIGPGDSPETHEIEGDVFNVSGYLPMSVALIEELSPEAWLIFELSHLRDLAVLKQMFLSGVNFGSRKSEGYRFTRELDKTNDSKLFRSRKQLEQEGVLKASDDLRAVAVRRALLELGWVAVWEGKCCRFEQWIDQPQWFAKAVDVLDHMDGAFPFGVRRIARNTDERTLFACIVPHMTPTMYTIEVCRHLPLKEAMSTYLLVSSLVLDYVVRFQVSSSVAISNIDALPFPSRTHLSAYSAAQRLLRNHPHQASYASARAAAEAVIAELYGLSLDDFAWILRDCDHPIERVCNKPFSRTLDPKGFWRVDKEQEPELRHPVLSLVAFHELKRIGLDAFLALNDGDGWMLPDTLCLADYGLGHDARASKPQPVASRLGERFLPWQLEQGVEESWEECRRHAELIARILAPPAAEATAETATPKEAAKPYAITQTGQAMMFAADAGQKDLFGNVIEEKPRGRKKKS